MLKYVMAALLIALALARPGTAAEKSGTSVGNFARAVAQPLKKDANGEQWRWALQASARKLRHPQTRRTITLLSMHHWGERSYYKNIEAHLGDADLILYEGPAHGMQKPDDIPEALEWLGRMQKLYVRLLDVSVQIDWEREIADVRWRNLDLSIERAFALMKAHDVKFPDKWCKWIEGMEKWLDAKPPAKEIADARDDAYGGLMQADILGESFLMPVHEVRDRAIFAGLQKVVAEGKHERIAMIYGAAPTAALEPRIVAELGYELESSCWHDVLWYVKTHAKRKGPAPARPKKEEEPPKQPK